MPFDKDIILRNYTAKNTVISRYLLVWKFCGKAQFAFPQNFHTRKSGEITVFLAVLFLTKCLPGKILAL